MNCKSVLEHYKLFKILGNIKKVVVRNVINRKLYVKPNFIEERTALCDILSELKTISVVFSQRRGAYEPGTYYSQPEFTPK